MSGSRLAQQRSGRQHCWTSQASTRQARVSDDRRTNKQTNKQTEEYRHQVFQRFAAGT